MAKKVKKVVKKTISKKAPNGKIIKGGDKAPNVPKKDADKVVKDVRAVLNNKTEGFVLVTEKTEKGCKASFHGSVKGDEIKRQLRVVLSKHPFHLELKERKTLPEILNEAQKEANEITKIRNTGKDHLFYSKKNTNKAILFYTLALVSAIGFEIFSPSKLFFIGTFVLVVIGFHFSDKARNFKGKSEGINEAADMVLQNKINKTLKK